MAAFYLMILFAGGLLLYFVGALLFFPIYKILGGTSPLWQYMEAL